LIAYALGPDFQDLFNWLMACISQAALKLLQRDLSEPVQTLSVRFASCGDASIQDAARSRGAQSGARDFVISNHQLAKRILIQQKDPEG
jgi:hypothetical protein